MTAMTTLAHPDMTLASASSPANEQDVNIVQEEKVHANMETLVK